MKYLLMVMIATASGYTVTSHEFGDEASCKLAETTMKRQFKAAKAPQVLRAWCSRYAGSGGSSAAGDWTPQ